MQTTTYYVNKIYLAPAIHLRAALPLFKAGCVSLGDTGGVPWVQLPVSGLAALTVEAARTDGEWRYTTKLNATLAWPERVPGGTFVFMCELTDGTRRLVGNGHRPHTSWKVTSQQPAAAQSPCAWTLAAEYAGEPLRVIG